MAKQIIEWEDSLGIRHKSEEEALSADRRHRIERHLAKAGVARGDIVDLRVIETFNAEFLKPIVEYFADLLVKAQERQR